MAGGRPTIMTPETISKLEHAFSIGCSDLEACLYANIGKTTLYNYQEDNPEFVERKESLKQNPVFKARTNVMNSIESGDVNNSRWLLERRKKDEFGSSQDINIGGQPEGSPIIHRIERVIIDNIADKNA